MKKFLLGIFAAIALLLPFAPQKADAQVVVAVGPRYHRGCYHCGYYHHHYYHRHYYHRY